MAESKTTPSAFYRNFDSGTKKRNNDSSLLNIDLPLKKSSCLLQSKTIDNTNKEPLTMRDLEILEQN